MFTYTRRWVSIGCVPRRYLPIYRPDASASLYCSSIPGGPNSDMTWLERINTCDRAIINRLDEQIQKGNLNQWCASLILGVVYLVGPALMIVSTGVAATLGFYLLAGIFLLFCCGVSITIKSSNFITRVATDFFGRIVGNK